MDCPMAAGDITIDARFLHGTLSPRGFPIARRNPIPQAEVLYDYQTSIHADATQVPIPASTAAVTASPAQLFNQTLGGCLLSRTPYSSSLASRGIIPLSRTTYQPEGSGKSTFRQLGQTDPVTPTLITSTGPIRGVRVDQYPRRHQCTMCDADYALVSGLNRHFTEKHLPWMACDFCDFQYPLGRKYLLTRHLETDHPIA
jgi:hypothetical protein